MKFVVCLAVALAVATPAFAGDLGISELRAGVMIDDFELHSTAPIWWVPYPSTINIDNLDTLSFDVLFRTPKIGAFQWMGSPRPVVGVDLNFKHESMVHAALNWHLPIAQTGFFAEAELGGALHDGQLKDQTAPFRNLGCPALFYIGFNVGYQISDHWNIMATEQHASQGGICGWTDNQGLNYTGVRLGYKF